MASNTSNLADRFESALKCAICLDLYNEPRSLRCGHIFCLHCIHPLIHFNDPFECPTCRQSCSVADMRKVFVVNHIIDILKSISGAAQHACHLCKKRTIMDNLWFCDGCEMKIYCSKCVITNRHGSQCNKIPHNLEEKQKMLIEWRRTIYEPDSLKLNDHIDRLYEVHRRILIICNLLMDQETAQTSKAILTTFQTEMTAIRNLANPLHRMATEPPSIDTYVVDCDEIMAEVTDRLKALENKLDGQLAKFQGCVATIATSIRGVLEGEALQVNIQQATTEAPGIPIPISDAPADDVPMQLGDPFSFIEGSIGDQNSVDTA